jgi:hypothetical protein
MLTKIYCINYRLVSVYTYFFKKIVDYEFRYKYISALSECLQNVTVLFDFISAVSKSKSVTHSRYIASKPLYQSYIKHPAILV